MGEIQPVRSREVRRLRAQVRSGGASFLSSPDLGERCGQGRAAPFYPIRASTTLPWQRRNSGFGGESVGAHTKPDVVVPVVGVVVNAIGAADVRLIVVESAAPQDPRSASDGRPRRRSISAGGEILRRFHRLWEIELGSDSRVIRDQRFRERRRTHERRRGRPCCRGRRRSNRRNGRSS